MEFLFEPVMVPTWAYFAGAWWCVAGGFFIGRLEKAEAEERLREACFVAEEE